MKRLPFALALLLLPSAALAMRPDPKMPPDFGSNVRARVADPARQQALTSGPAWAKFLAANPGHWRVTWDDRAGTPRAIIGDAIPLVPANATAGQVEAASRAFLNTLQYLSGVNDSLLKTHTLTKVGDTWYVRFDRVTADGTPVLGAYAELRVIGGQVRLIRLETHPEADLARTAKLSANGAIAKVHQGLGLLLSSSSLRSEPATKVIVPVADGAGWRYVPGYEVLTSAATGKWKSVVDAIGGDVLSRESLVRYAVSGTITGAVEPRTIGDTPVNEPMPFIQPSVAGNQDTADANGAYTDAAAAPGSTTTVALSGSFIHIHNTAGAEGSATATTADINITSANATPAEIDTYRHANEVRSWALTAYASPGDVPPAFASWLGSQVTANVNINDTCNAFWDGSSLNFFHTDTQCNNTGEIADVVYHEFGHGIHQNNLVSGGIDGAVGEGTGDSVAMQITGDHVLGPNFFVGGGSVRDLEPDMVYPDDLSGEVHNDGLIWGGTMWDLRKNLIATYGDAAGKAKLADLFMKTIAAGPSLDQLYDEMILADGAGTPDQCDIDQAFGLHGLTGTGSALALTHTEPVGVAADAATTITATEPTTSSLCPGAPTITAVALKYTLNGNTPQTVALAKSGSNWSAQIPGQPVGTAVRYWFEETLSTGATVVTPRGGPDTAFGYSTPFVSVWKDDFETDKGWTHGGTLDDWQRGAPTGGLNDPMAAFSGTNVLGNNLQGDGQYQMGADNFAESPLIDCRGCKNAHLRLRRWLTVEDASYDHARILVNNQEVYGNPVGLGQGGARPKDGIWSFEDYDISQYADGHNVTIRFELSSDGLQGGPDAAEYGGWNVDDVEILTPAEPSSGGGGGGGCGCDLGAMTSLPGGAMLIAAGSLLAFVRRKRA